MYISFFLDVDECTLVEPCHNNGTCVNAFGSFSCMCAETFTGHLCTVDTTILPRDSANKASKVDLAVGTTLVIVFVLLVCGSLIGYYALRRYKYHFGGKTLHRQ